MKGCLYGIAGVVMTAPSQLWQRCFRAGQRLAICWLKGATLPFQSSVEMAVRATPFQSRALVERAMMIGVSKQNAAVKWQPFQSNRAYAT
jgi:hypothetical protein